MKPSEAKGPQRLRVHLSLLFPVIALALFHFVNLGNIDPEFRWKAGFIAIPFRFLAQLSDYRIQLPDGFLSGTLQAFAGFIPFWMLGFGIASRAIEDRPTRMLAGFPLGLGGGGVLLELLAIPNLLTPFTTWMVYAVCFTCGIWLLATRPVRATPAIDINRCGSLLRFFCWAIFASITLFCFQHALFYPDNYWDALIYYLYYSKLIFLHQGIPFPVDASGFPELVQCQVGLGLGANYPHLFLLWQASAALAWGTWSGFPAQWIPPIAGLATALLVYRVAMLRWRSERLALWYLVLVQSVPYWLWYQNWVSDYPLAVWLTMALAAVAGLAGTSAWSITALCCGAIGGSHLNYLMVSLWWFPCIAILRMGWQGLNRRIGVILFAAMLLSSTWFIRNELVTGNPVYAFFPEIFGGTNINLDVLRSCEVEWAKNGDGVGRLGPTLLHRLLGSPYYFLLDSNTHIKWAFLPFGWLLPGCLFALRRKQGMWGWTIGGYFLFLLFYQYCVSGLYLYHIMPAIPLMVLISAAWLKSADQNPGACGRMLSALVLFAALTVGLPSAILGSKFSNVSLRHALHPGMNPEVFLSESIPEYGAWQVMNEKLEPGAGILTHENRHYYLRDDLKLIHLDDYRLVPLYGEAPQAVLKKLRELGVRYYLRIGNEKNHPILAQLGVEKFLHSNSTLLFKQGPTELYRFKE